MDTRKSLSMLLILATIFIGALNVRVGSSQEIYPNRPVTVVVNTGPGTKDTLTRAFCKAAEKELGQPIVVENKPGATGAIGINYVLKSKPDGYTLGVSSSAEYIFTPHMQKYPFNVLTDLTDIFPFFKYTWGLCARADAPWTRFEDLIAYAKKNPGKIKYGTPGVASGMHIIMERIAMREGIKWTAIPFKSGGEPVLATLGGNTDLVPQTPLLISGHIKAGKLRLLLILSDSKWGDYPNVPNILEKGYKFFAFSYGSVFGPAGVSEPIKQKLENVFKQAMKDPAYLELVKRSGLEIPTFNSGREYADFWKSEYEENGKVIKALGF